MEAPKPAPFNLELKLYSRFSGAGTHPAPAQSTCQFVAIYIRRPLDIYGSLKYVAASIEQ
jgi:hypothetical protein